MAKSAAASSTTPSSTSSASAPSSDETTSQPAKAAGAKDGTSGAFKDAADRYGNALVQLSSALQEAQQEALQTYLDALANSFKPGRFDAVSAAYHDLIKAASGPEAAKIAGAQAAYVDTIKGLHSGIESTTKTATQDYAEAQQTIWTSAQEEAAAAYASFIKDIKPALGDLQSLAADPASLILIGHSLCVAGFLGAQTAASGPTSSNRVQSEQMDSRE